MFCTLNHPFTFGVSKCMSSTLPFHMCLETFENFERLQMCQKIFKPLRDHLSVQRIVVDATETHPAYIFWSGQWHWGRVRGLPIETVIKSHWLWLQITTTVVTSVNIQIIAKCINGTRFIQHVDFLTLSVPVSTYLAFVTCSVSTLMILEHDT